MCAYNPGVRDQSGEILAAGMIRGVDEYRKDKRRKEEEEAAVDFLRKNGTRLGLNVTDDAELKSAVKSAGGGPQAVHVFSLMAEMEARRKAEEQQRQMALLQQQILQTKLNENEARNQGLRALGEAVGGDDGVTAETIARYAQRAGTGIDPETLKILGALRGRPEFSPSEIKMPSGARVIRNTPSSVIPDPTQKEPKAPEPSMLGKLVAERDRFRAEGREDVAAEYDRQIRMMGVKVDAFGNPINPEAVARDPFEMEGLPQVKTRAELGKVEAGQKYVAPDGRVYTRGQEPWLAGGGGTPAAGPQTKEELLALVRSGKVGVEQAKAIAARKKW